MSSWGRSGGYPGLVKATVPPAPRIVALGAFRQICELSGAIPHICLRSGASSVSRAIGGLAVADGATKTERLEIARFAERPTA
jgi:hypothetical protein